MKQIAYVDDLYVDRLKIRSIIHDRDDVDIFLINKRWHGLSGNDAATLHKETKYLVGYLVEIDMDTLYEEKNYLMKFSFIRVIDKICNYFETLSLIMVAFVVACILWSHESKFWFFKFFS